ncbi:HET domain protein [Xylaria grammica]|nr:HET domain protein [Xylaria grammica]
MGYQQFGERKSHRQERDLDLRGMDIRNDAKPTAAPYVSPQLRLGTTSIAASQPTKTRRTKERASSMPPTARALPPYHFHPLPNGCIRLLQLLPHRDERAPIRCHLIDHPLLDPSLGEGPHLYEALSYVWGSPEKPRLVYTEAGYIAVTKSLHAALLRLRDRTLPRVLWVDGICINQDDIQERGCQVQLMAMVYAKATRVVVWLEEVVAGNCQLDGDTLTDGSRALEVIRATTDSRSNTYQIDETSHEEIIELFQRSWFQRIWVLQEVSAARQILIMTRRREIDGHAFFLCLSKLKLAVEDVELQSIVRSVMYLLEGSILRPRHGIAATNEFSLDISPLGQLIDMYQRREATDRRDKVYALLGMSSDNHSRGVLSANYQISWKELFSQLIKYILGRGVSVETWDEKEIAVVRAKGYIIGRVESVKSDGAWNPRQVVEVSLRYPFYNILTFHTTANTVRVYDAVCFLQGASNPTIIRPCQDYCTIAATCITPIKAGLRFNDLLKAIHLDSFFTYNLLLLWDWGKSWEKLEESRDCEFYLQSQGLKRAGIIDHWDRAARFHTIGVILKEVNLCDRASEYLEKAIELYERIPGIQHAWTPRILPNYYRLREKAKKLGLIASILARERDGLSITQEGILDIAKEFDRELMEFLFDQKGGGVQITERVLQAAAENIHYATEVMMFLLSQRGDKITITESMLRAAAGNLYCAKELVPFLLNQQGDRNAITENVLAAAASCHGKHAPRLIPLLLEQQVDKNIITEKVLISATYNNTHAEEVIALLLEQKFDKIAITEEVLRAAVRRIKVLEMLVNYYGDTIHFIRNVLQWAMQISCRESAEFLRSRYGID